MYEYVQGNQQAAFCRLEKLQTIKKLIYLYADDMNNEEKKF